MVAAARTQTLGEEVANALSHGLGLLLAVASLPILVWQAARLGSAIDIVAASVFAGTAIVPAIEAWLPPPPPPPPLQAASADARSTEKIEKRAVETMAKFQRAGDAGGSSGGCAAIATPWSTGRSKRSRSGARACCSPA